ncbi:MAG: sodium-dependent bicarbonate transport family permease [Ilumatobacteraceae bacterium]|nr:sodium-dependent bicarbonate transport family permease [Ilumatobacteraceae bacterium]
MSINDLVSLNLGSPVVLAFLLGVVAAFIKSDLRFPEQVTSLLSTYLLFAIGLKGGMRLRESSLTELTWPVLITLILGVATPVVAFLVARSFLRLDTINAAAMAAHYGSVSAVTFTAAESFTRAAGTLSEGYLPALVAVLEVPGIVVALVIASRASQGRSMSSAIHEVMTGKSVVLLLGGLIIGAIANQEALTRVEPFFVGLFQGMLCLFLLDLGTLAGQRFNSIRRAGARLLIFATALPIVFGVVGVLLASAVGMSEGGATVLAAMAASASYIAAPAAVRVGLPEADIGLSLGAALGVTFPFNLIIGIPLYSEVAAVLA